jgi:hypothetical protein
VATPGSGLFNRYREEVDQGWSCHWHKKVKNTMIGEMIGELKGKVTGTRILTPHETTPKIETSQSQSGKILGLETMDMTTYWSIMQPNGMLYGEGNGVIMSKSGDMAMYKASGVGKMTGKGSAVSFRGVLYFQTMSQKWAALNSSSFVYEYDTDEMGNTSVKIWAWK